jgi:hypothetical protein
MLETLPHPALLAFPHSQTAFMNEMSWHHSRVFKTRRRFCFWRKISSPNMEESSAWPETMHRFSDKKAKHRWSRGGVGATGRGCCVFFLSYLLIFYISFFCYSFLFLFYFVLFFFFIHILMERYFCIFIFFLDFIFYLYFHFNIIFSISFFFLSFYSISFIFLVSLLFLFYFYLLTFYFLLYFFLFLFLYAFLFNIFPPLILLLFEMRFKLIINIIISCSGYTYLVRTIITTYSDPCSIVRTIITTYSDPCSNLFWHYICFCSWHTKLFRL